MSGKFISVFNKTNGYFEILRADNKHHLESNNITALLDEDNRTENIHFLS